MKPYVYKTTDYGKTWTALPRAGKRRARLRARDQGRHGQPEPAVPGHRIRPLDLASMAASAGRSTRAATFPAVAVRDIVVHPRESDLVLATHGRGIWIIDDISPLRALTPDLMSKDAAFIPGPARRPVLPGQRRMGRKATRAFTGPQPSRRRPDHLLPEEPPHLRRSEDRDFRCRTASWWTRIAGSKHRGLNRATWSMRLKPPTRSAGGHRALRRRHRSARAARHLHGEDDQGRQGLHHEAERRARSARQVHGGGSQGAVRSGDEGLQDCSST